MKVGQRNVGPAADAPGRKAPELPAFLPENQPSFSLKAVGPGHWWMASSRRPDHARADSSCPGGLQAGSAKLKYQRFLSHYELCILRAQMGAVSPTRQSGVGRPWSRTRYDVLSNPREVCDVLQASFGKPQARIAAFSSTQVSPSSVRAIGAKNPVVHRHGAANASAGHQQRPSCDRSSWDPAGFHQRSCHDGCQPELRRRGHSHGDQDGGDHGVVEDQRHNDPVER